jgi:hypothetical protein
MVFLSGLSIFKGLMKVAGFGKCSGFFLYGLLHGCYIRDLEGFHLFKNIY